jgi:uracil-DNA glycosylase
VIHKVAEEKQHVAFILWGDKAKKKGAFIDTNKHLVIKSSHPSPRSAYKTDKKFFGSKPFSKTNNYLQQTGQTSINW